MLLFFVFFLYRTSPAAPIVFQFDITLIEDTLGNKLQPNALTVDNLTVDWLRSRLNDLETSIKECQDKQAKLDCNGSTNKPASPILNGVNGTGNDVIKYVLKSIIVDIDFLYNMLFVFILDTLKTWIH